ncbi:MAG: NUDIX domain-containing protein [Proteobacteria bacterium]|nr:NUDIX domain-containing protein [Pseudomonadota bacterium]MDA1058527.1 NUDIX domain-containing protein [Pseudomonadota bacterium]
MSRSAQIIERKPVYEGYFDLHEVTFQHTMVSGVMSPAITRLVLEVGEVAAGLLVDRTRRRVVLIEQFRLPALAKDGGWLVEVVAGRVDQGETVEEAFRRESIEETGYDVANLQQILRFYSASGTLAEHMTLFCADIADRINEGGGTDADEDIRVLDWRYDEFFAAIDAGRIIDAKTIIAGQWLRQHLS